MALPDPLHIKWTGRIKYFPEKKKNIGKTDRWTDDGRKVITIAHPEHSSGELKKTRYVSVWHRCPLPGPSSLTRRHFAKNEVEKRAKTLIIIGRFYPKLNLTIFYDYIPVYKIWIQYTNQSFLKKYRKVKVKVKKGHNSHNNGLILP